MKRAQIKTYGGRVIGTELLIPDLGASPNFTAPKVSA